MRETIDFLKDLINKRIPWEKRKDHDNVSKVLISTAYRLINEGELDFEYESLRKARKALNGAINASEITKTINRLYKEETKYYTDPKIAVRWGHIATDIEEIFGITLDREELGLYSKQPVKCECGALCVFEPMDIRSKRPVWHCPVCGATVGVHAGTDIPLGKPVSGSIGKKRIEVHKEINRIIESGMGVNHIYKLLARKMNLSPEETHAGLFNEEQCEEAVKILRDIKGSFSLN